MAQYACKQANLMLYKILNSENVTLTFNTINMQIFSVTKIY